MTIPELLKDLGIKFIGAGESDKVTEGWSGVSCPFCHSNKPLLGFSHRSFRCHCWQCGGHNPVEALALLTNLSQDQIRKLVIRLDKNNWGLPYPDEAIPRGGRYNPPPPGEWTAVHDSFLEGRGLDPEEVRRRWGVWATDQYQKPNWSLIVPVTYNGKAISWTSRSAGMVKYYQNARPDQESMSLKSILYGADLARNAVAVAEGPLDAWAIGPGGCATLGVGYTKSQVRQIASFPLRIVVFDSEPMAQRRARKLVAELGMFDGSTLNVVLSSGKDPSRCDRSELGELRAMLK